MYLKKKHTLYFILLLCLQFCFSQEKELDSIKNRIEIYTQRDSIRVRLLIDLTEYYTTRDINKILPLINEALSISNELNYIKGKGTSLNTLATYYILKGELDKALSYALEAKQIFKNNYDRTNLLLIYNNLARIYTKSNKPEKALEINLENIKIIKNDDPSPTKAGLYFYVGTTYYSLNQFIDAEKYYKEALQISTDSKFLTGIAISEGSLGELYNQQSKYTEAISYLNKSMIFFKKHNQVSNIASTYLSLAESYNGLENYETAIDYNLKSIKIYKELNNLGILNQIYLSQSKLYDKTTNYKKSNEFLKLHYKVSDSILSTDKIKIIEELQTKYETEKVQQEIEIAEAKSTQNRNYFIASLLIGILLLISALLYFFFFKTKKKGQLTALKLKQTEQKLVLEQQLKISEITAIKAQMNPHFIFNALNSIQDLIMIKDIRSSNVYLGKFADLMRETLEISNENFISLAKEIEILELYLDLEKLRFGKDFHCNIHTSCNNQQLTTIQIPTMLIQPYVENAIKHGLLHKTGKKELTINFLNENNALVCEIIDNGVGRKKSAEIKARREKSYRSFSTEANKKRIDLIRESTGQDISLEIFDLHKNDFVTGTKVVFKFPI